MRLPTSQLPPKYRYPLRFIINGLVFMIVQTLLYWLFLLWFNSTWSLSFAFGIEMILNYIATNYYIFNTRPQFSNAGGFIIARVVNYFIQIGFLEGLLYIGMGTHWAGPVSIVLAGIINYFVVKFFFKK